MTLPGQVETQLPEGRRLISAVRVVEDGARAVLFLEPGVVRVDAVPFPDMFRLLVRPLDPADPVVSEARDRPASLGTNGVDEVALPLLGTAATTLRSGDGRTWELALATLRDRERGSTRFTVQVLATSPAR